MQHKADTSAFVREAKSHVEPFEINPLEIIPVE